MSMSEERLVETIEVVRLDARAIPPPANISEAARAVLATPRPGQGAMPAQSDKEGWRRLIAQRDAASAAMSAPFAQRLKADVAARTMGGVPVYVGTPQGERLVSRDKIVFDIHGGALLFGGGEANVSFEAKAIALRTGRVAYALDYRVPPDGPYPAALEDCIAVYRALLEETPAEKIVVSGTSAGGNLAAALLLRARDEGLPMPAGALLMTPELDLTESGDSFETLMGLDVVLQSRLTEMNLAYAAGADLAHPYLSPLMGDVSGFPPTLLQAGTRDIFLSNAVIMHRKLRRAGVRAELHVWEGMPHGGFGGITPEDREMSAEMQAFIASLAS
jgi:acetyl esterase/lipase